MIREWTIIGIVSEPILGVSYRLLSYRPIHRYIAAGSAAVNQLHYTGHQRAVATCHPLHANAIDGPRYSRMLTATLQPLITCHTLALQPTHQTTEQTAEPGD